jgi:hypothetical protein
MPYNNEWVEPKWLFTHRGVDVFEAYKEDEIQEPLTFCFQIPDPDGYYLEFDVRELPEYRKPKYRGKSDNTIICAAIDSGSLFRLLKIKSQIDEVQRTYEVDVMRVATCGHTFKVQACSLMDAHNKALEMAYNTVLDKETSAEYHVSTAKEIKDGKRP